MTKSVKPLPELKKKALTLKQKNQHNFSFGQEGEKRATAFLQQKGYQILATNLSFKNFELDIIALDKEHNEIVFVEVKTRFNTIFGNPSQAVNRSKIKSMQIAARVYLNRTHLNNDYRFDIITVTLNKIEHFTNITWLS